MTDSSVNFSRTCKTDDINKFIDCNLFYKVIFSKAFSVKYDTSLALSYIVSIRVTVEHNQYFIFVWNLR